MSEADQLPQNLPRQGITRREALNPGRQVFPDSTRQTVSRGIDHRHGVSSIICNGDIELATVRGDRQPTSRALRIVADQYPGSQRPAGSVDLRQLRSETKIGSIDTTQKGHIDFTASGLTATPGNKAPGPPSGLIEIPPTAALVSVLITNTPPSRNRIESHSRS